MTDKAKKTLDGIVKGLESWIAQYEGEKAKFIEKLERNPVEAFRWSGTVMSFAPRFDLAKTYLNAIADRRAEQGVSDSALSDQTIIENLREVASERCIQFAQGSRRSTSPQSNYIEDEFGRAWGELFNLTKWGY